MQYVIRTRDLQDFYTTLLFGGMLLIIMPVSTIVAQPSGIPSGFDRIFNGRDLAGWHISRTNHHGTVGNFYVEDESIILEQHPFGQGGILLTDKKYKDFELYLEFKGAPGTNGGIFLRSNESGSAYQLELAGDGGPGTGNLFGEKLSTSTTAEAKNIEQYWKKGDWNSLRIRFEGAKPLATLQVNGHQIWEVQFERNDLIGDVTEGMIALQLHWSQTTSPVPGGSCCEYSWKPGASHKFRNIAIKEL